MTSNQIAFQRYVEDARHNVAGEYETNRSNVARETETNRSNTTYESELWRSNTAREAENLRSNLQREQENLRSNKAREAENYRSNWARESETNRANVTHEVETNRANLEQERLKEQSNSFSLATSMSPVAWADSAIFNLDKFFKQSDVMESGQKYISDFTTGWNYIAEDLSKRWNETVDKVGSWFSKASADAKSW